MSFYTTLRGPDISRNVIISGYVTFYQHNKCFVKILFSLLKKCRCGPDLARGPQFADPCLRDCSKHFLTVTIAAGICIALNC